MTKTANLLAHSRKKWAARGYILETAEHMVRLPGRAPYRKDLFGFVDLIAVPHSAKAIMGEGEPWVWLQVTSRGNSPARIKKIRTEAADAARAILRRGDRIVVEGWDQPEGPGTRWRDWEREITERTWDQ